MRLSVKHQVPNLKREKAGYLWKQSEILKDWKQRYFKVSHFDLIYYKDAKEIVYTPLLLSKVTPSLQHEKFFAFTIFSATTQKEFTLLAESEADREE